MKYKIPPLPNTLAEILQVLAQETPPPDNDRLVEIIQHDPAVALYVLRQANSAYYGVRKQITCIDRAVTFLGWKSVSTLVLAAALRKTFSYLEPAPAQNVYEYLMQTSLATAAFSRDLALHLQVPLPEVVFSVGLLHQVGRLVLLYSSPGQYVPLWYEGARDQVVLAVPSPEREQACFGIHSRQLGALTMRAWGLPSVFATIADHLSRPAEAPLAHLRLLAHLVATGSALAQDLIAAGDGEGAAAQLLALSQARHADVNDLAGFLETRREPVRALAQAVLTG